MADTLANVPLKQGVWVDLYDATGIAVGTKIGAQNLGEQGVLVKTSAGEPTDLSGYRRIPPDAVWENDSGDSGAWAICLTADGALNIGEA